MEYWCKNCEEPFTSEEGRCPYCLRISTVVERSKARAARDRTAASGDAPKAAPISLFRGPGLLVTIAILVPLSVLNRMEWGYGWGFTFVSALVAFGAGHAVNWLWHNRKRERPR